MRVRVRCDSRYDARASRPDIEVTMVNGDQLAGCFCGVICVMRTAAIGLRRGGPGAIASPSSLTSSAPSFEARAFSAFIAS